MKQITLTETKYAFLIYTLGFALGKNEYPDEKLAILELYNQIIETAITIEEPS